MKKMASVVIAATMAVMLAGCAKSIEGSVDSVVEQCQELPTNESANVTVTGSLLYGTNADRDADGTMLIMLGGDGCSVSAMFYNADDKTVDEINTSRRVTIKGKLEPDRIGRRTVFITDCKLA